MACLLAIYTLAFNWSIGDRCQTSLEISQGDFFNNGKNNIRLLAENKDCRRYKHLFYKIKERGAYIIIIKQSICIHMHLLEVKMTWLRLWYFGDIVRRQGPVGKDSNGRTCWRHQEKRKPYRVMDVQYGKQWPYVCKGREGRTLSKVTKS